MTLPEGHVYLASITVTQALDPEGREAMYVSTGDDRVARAQLIGMLMMAVHKLAAGAE